MQTTACHLLPVVADILKILERTIACHVLPLVADIILELANNSLSCVACCCRHSEHSGARKQQLVMYYLLLQTLFWSMQTTACHVLPIVPDIILERANISLSFVTCYCRHCSGACKQQLVMCYLLLQTLFWSMQTTACHVLLTVVADIMNILEHANNSLSCVTCCCRHSEDSGAHEQQPGDVPQIPPQPLGAAAPDLPTILLPVHGGCAAHCLQRSVLSLESSLSLDDSAVSSKPRLFP